MSPKVLSVKGWLLSLALGRWCAAIRDGHVCSGGKIVMLPRDHNGRMWGGAGGGGVRPLRERCRRDCETSVTVLQPPRREVRRFLCHVLLNMVCCLATGPEGTHETVKPKLPNPSSPVWYLSTVMESVQHSYFSVEQEVSPSKQKWPHCSIFSFKITTLIKARVWAKFRSLVR